MVTIFFSILFKMIEGRIQAGGLAAAGRAGDQDEAIAAVSKRLNAD